MIENWIQFGILLTAILGFFLRNEHRITKVEERLAGLTVRIITLERKRT